MKLCTNVAIAGLTALVSFSEAAALGSNELYRRANEFFLNEHFLTGTFCGPVQEGNCETLEERSWRLHNWCGGERCNAHDSGLEALEDSACDRDIVLCDRTIRLVKVDTANSCASMFDLNDNAPTGELYAKILEGDVEVGECFVDVSQSYAINCSAFGGESVHSKLKCTIN